MKRHAEEPTEEIATCRTCGLLQRMPLAHGHTRVKCARCNFELYRRKPDSRSRTLALALGALILYVPANILPIVETDYWGMHEKTTIFDGIHGLFQGGSYFVGGLVFTTSILTPALKILGLLILSITLPWGGLGEIPNVDVPHHPDRGPVEHARSDDARHSGGVGGDG